MEILEDSSAGPLAVEDMGPDWMFTNGANFEIFTHVTRFCGHKVILLG